MDQLEDALRDLAVAATTPGGTPENTMNCVRAFLEAAQDEDLPSQNRALARLAETIASTDGPRASAIAIGAGALVEGGADPTIALGSILGHLPELLSLAADFVQACEARAEAVEADFDREDEEAEEEQEGSPTDRFASEVAEEMPAEGLAWLSLEPMCLGAIAMLSRSATARKSVSGRELLLERLRPVADVQGEAGFLEMMLQVLDDEVLLVLHPELRRGYCVRIRGIADNFQLHTLLADALIGDPEEGGLPGERPDPRVVAAARDEPVDPEASHATGAFNLWTWRGLQPDGNLMEAQEGSDYWVWGEGIPADIPPFKGVRVVLLGEPPYHRSWNADRRFDGMVGELEVVEVLPGDVVKKWLHRIAAAPR